MASDPAALRRPPFCSAAPSLARRFLPWRPLPRRGLAVAAWHPGQAGAVAAGVNAERGADAANRGAGGFRPGGMRGEGRAPGSSRCWRACGALAPRPSASAPWSWGVVAVRDPHAPGGYVDGCSRNHALRASFMSVFHCLLLARRASTTPALGRSFMDTFGSSSRGRPSPRWRRSGVLLSSADWGRVPLRRRANRDGAPDTLAGIR